LTANYWDLRKRMNLQQAGDVVFEIYDGGRRRNKRSKERIIRRKKRE